MTRSHVTHPWAPGLYLHRVHTTYVLGFSRTLGWFVTCWRTHGMCRHSEYSTTIVMRCRAPLSRSNDTMSTRLLHQQHIQQARRPSGVICFYRNAHSFCVSRRYMCFYRNAHSLCVARRSICFVRNAHSFCVLKSFYCKRHTAQARSMGTCLMRDKWYWCIFARLEDHCNVCVTNFGIFDASVTKWCIQISSRPPNNAPTSFIPHGISPGDPKNVGIRWSYFLEVPSNCQLWGTHGFVSSHAWVSRRRRERHLSRVRLDVARRNVLESEVQMLQFLFLFLTGKKT